MTGGIRGTSFLAQHNAQQYSTVEEFFLNVGKGLLKEVGSKNLPAFFEALQRQQKGSDSDAHSMASNSGRDNAEQSDRGPSSSKGGGYGQR